jgi:hypothetical protein
MALVGDGEHLGDLDVAEIEDEIAVAVDVDDVGGEDEGEIAADVDEVGCSRGGW